MAEINFQILGDPNGVPNVETFSGSGLAFFGSTPGSSVQIGEYQDTTYISNGDGSITKDITSNNKWNSTGSLSFPSGRVTLDSTGGPSFDIGVSGVRTMYGTLGIRFGHPTNVNVQNCQLRIYDRVNVGSPASGVNTKVAEIANFGGGDYNLQGSDDGFCSDAQGSGDLWWWGEPWPSEMCTKNYYTNSVGTRFYNGTDADTVTNGDSRLAAAAVAGSYDTVGGTGIIVPLLDSPGSGQKGLLTSRETLSGSGCEWPKWTQYVLEAKQNEIFGFTLGDGSDTSKSLNSGTLEPIRRTYGGTGVSTHHTWSVAISASPLSTGAKEQYGLYVSLEYF